MARQWWWAVAVSNSFRILWVNLDDILSIFMGLNVLSSALHLFGIVDVQMLRKLIKLKVYVIKSNNFCYLEWEESDVQPQYFTVGFVDVNVCNFCSHT